MSRFVKIHTQLRDIELVKQALDDLDVQYETGQQLWHIWSKTRVQADVLVKTANGGFALVRNDEGALEAQGDDMVLRRQSKLLNQVSQRYAYHKVLAEANRAGFSLVEEKQSNDQTIRLVVRRWA